MSVGLETFNQRFRFAAVGVIQRLLSASRFVARWNDWICPVLNHSYRAPSKPRSTRNLWCQRAVKSSQFCGRLLRHLAHSLSINSKSQRARADCLIWPSSWVATKRGSVLFQQIVISNFCAVQRKATFRLSQESSNVVCVPKCFAILPSYDMVSLHLIVPLILSGNWNDLLREKSGLYCVS